MYWLGIIIITNYNHTFLVSFLLYNFSCRNCYNVFMTFMLYIYRVIIYLFLFRIDLLLTMLRMRINEIRFKMVKNLEPSPS